MAGVAVGGCMLLGSQAFTAPQSGTVSATEFLRAQQGAVQQQAAPGSGSSSYASPAAFVGAAGMLAVGATAASKRKAVKAPVTEIRALPKALENTGGPLPDMVWDPLGLMEGKSDEQLLHWRAVELKHGRVSMLAVLGWFHVAGGWHFIGDAALGYRASDNPLINVQQMPMGAMWQLIFFFVCIEWLTAYVCKPPEGRPWDVLGWNDIIYDEEDPLWKIRQLQEINNSRLAMVAILGLIIQTAVTGNYGQTFLQPCFGLCPDFDELLFGSRQGEWLGAPFAPGRGVFPAMYPGQDNFLPF
jgi:hypothetical protein